MLHLTLILADVLIVATRGVADWVAIVTDAPTGNSRTVSLTDGQMGALAALAIAGDDSMDFDWTREFWKDSVVHPIP